MPSFSQRSYQKIVRSHFMKDILDALEELQENAFTSHMISSVDRILTTIRDLEDYSDQDSILEVLFAFYDALVADNSWANYSSEQYKGVKELLQRLANKATIRVDDIEDAIMKLENLGFDTTPYELDMDTEEM